MTNAAPPCQGDQLMANFYREHLTIIDERDFTYNIQHFSGLVVLANTGPCPETPPDVPFQINRSALREAILHYTGVELPLESISCYLNSYLLLTRSTEEATCILAVPFIFRCNSGQDRDIIWAPYHLRYV